MVSQFRVLEGEFSRMSELRERVDTICETMGRFKEVIDRMTEGLKVQNMINVDNAS